MIKLTSEEQDILNNNEKTFQTFYKDPSIKNYIHLKSLENIYNKKDPNMFKYYILCARFEYSHLEDSLNDDELLLYKNKIAKIMNKNTIITPNDIDILWACYYVTGDKKYSDRIQYIIHDNNQHSEYRGVAALTYAIHFDPDALKEQKINDMVKKLNINI